MNAIKQSSNSLDDQGCTGCANQQSQEQRRKHQLERKQPPCSTCHQSRCRPDRSGNRQPQNSFARGFYQGSWSWSWFIASIVSNWGTQLCTRYAAPRRDVHCSALESLEPATARLKALCIMDSDA